MAKSVECANLQFIGFPDEVVEAAASVCVSDRKPQFSVVHDATVTRFDPSCTLAEFSVDGFRHSEKRIVQGGVFDSNGNLCSLSRHRRVRGYPIDFPSHLSELPKNEREPEASLSRAVYGGMIFVLTSHYGHFLIDGLARGAALLDGPELPIVFLGDGNSDAAGRAVTAFEAAGIDPARFVFATRPLRVGELYLPEQSLCSQECALAPQAELFDRIAGDSPPASRRIFVSRRLHDAFNPTRYRYVGEASIEEEFRKAGFEIIYPELLSMIEQARLFRSAALCVGLVGSAMHNVVYCRPGTRVVYINHEPHLNFTYPLIDKLKGIKSTYIQATPTDVVGHVDARFWSLQEMDVINALYDTDVLSRPLGTAADRDTSCVDKSNVDLLTRLSQILSEGGSDSKRLNALKELQGIFGEDPRLLYQLFRVCERSRDWNSAIEYLWKICDIIGRLPVLLRKMAVSHAKLGNFEAACRFALEWAEIYPHDTLAHTFVCHYQEKCGRLGEARAAADRALTTNPYDHNALCRAGRLRMREDPLRAAADLERAAAVWPSSFEPNFHASKCKAALGELDGALSYATRAVELKPDHPGAQKHLKALQSRRNAS